MKIIRGAFGDVPQVATLDLYSSWAHANGVYFRSSSRQDACVEAEGFIGFNLKNGWKIVRIIEYRNPQNRNGGWSWIVKPQPGSDNPYLRIAIETKGDAFQGVGLGIVIRGPRGTNPYR